MEIDPELVDNGIFPTKQKSGYFRCSICAIEAIFQDARGHLKAPGHVGTLERFNLSFVGTQKGVSCRVCGDKFEWEALQAHAKVHGLVPWYEPPDRYKTFFVNHIVEWDTQFYCYCCDVYFPEWSTAYIHSGKKSHQQLVKEHEPVNDFITYPPSSVPYDILVSNGFTSTQASTTVTCSICECTNIGIRNVLPHVTGIKHVELKKEYLQQFREWKSQKEFEDSQPKAWSVKQSAGNDSTNDGSAAGILKYLPCMFVLQTGDDEYSCEICDREFNSRAHVDTHVKGGLHASSISTYGCDNIWRKQASSDIYQCASCECPIIGIKNVHQHVRGVRHWNSLSADGNDATEIQDITTNNNNIKVNETTVNNHREPGLSFPDNHMQMNGYQDGAKKFICKLCDVTVLGDVNIPEHTAGKIHTFRVQHLLNSIYLEDRTNYHCRFCDCMIPGVENIYVHLKGNRHAKACDLSLGQEAKACDLSLDKEEKACNGNLEKVEKESKRESISPPEVVSSTDEHIEKRKGGEFHCKLCDETIPDDSQLQLHVTAENHAFGMQQLAEYISLKKGTTYHCKCCNCGIPGLENVYSHIGGNRHVRSLNDTTKVKDPNSVEPKKQPENIIKPSPSSASSSALANGLKLPNNHIEKRNNGKLCCRLCNESIPADSNLQQHLKDKSHTSNSQLLSKYIFFAEQNYHCRCCSCMVPGVENIYRHIHGSRHIKSMQDFEKPKKDALPIDSMQDKSPRKIEELDHIVRINDTLSQCQLCDSKNLDTSAVENHIAENGHRETLKLLSSIISPRKNDKFSCKACDWTLCGMDNVYKHFRGTKHMDSQNTTIKTQKIGSTESIDGRSSVDSSKSHSKITWIKPAKDYSVREVLCKICNITFKSPSDLHSHLAIHVGQEFASQEPENATAVKTTKAALKHENGTAELQRSELQNQTSLSNGHSIDQGVSTENGELANSAPDMLPSNSSKNSEVKRRSSGRSSVQMVLKLLNWDNDYIHDMRDKLREFELAIKLCWINETNDIFCLICSQDVAGTIQSYYNHLKSSVHRKYFADMEKDHAMFERVPNQLSALDLALQCIVEINEDLVRCLACKKHLVNTDFILRRHINDKTHEETCKELRLRTAEYFEAIKRRLQCNWYDIHQYRCEPCSEDFATELNFAKHLRSTAHAMVLRKSNNIEKETINDFCPPCALLWLGFSTTYENHCENPKHKWAVWRGLSENQDLPKSLQTLLNSSEQYIDDIIKHLYLIAPMERDKEETLIRDLEIAVEAELPSAKAVLFRSRARGFYGNDGDVEIFLDCGNMYDGEKSSEDKISTFMTIVHHCLDTNPQSWYEETLFTNRRLSIIKARHRATGITCSITFGNGLPVENMKLITYYTRIFSPCQKLMLFLNQWLLLCDSAELQSIPYHALYWCVIFCLQKESLLPSVASTMNGESRLIAGWEVGISLDSSNSNSETNFDMKDLLTRFFKFWANFDYRHEVACPLLGETVEKRAFADPQSLPKEMARYSHYLENSDDPQCFKIDSVMCIQDPLNLQRNLADTVSKVCLSRFRANCAKSLNFINSMQM